MENILLSSSTRPIVDCRKFTGKNSDGSPIVKFSVDYVVKKKTEKTYQTNDGQTRNVWDSVVEFKVFDRNKLPASFDKKSDSEICQELRGKSLVIEQKIV